MLVILIQKKNISVHKLKNVVNYKINHIDQIIQTIIVFVFLNVKMTQCGINILQIKKIIAGKDVIIVEDIQVLMKLIKNINWLELKDVLHQMNLDPNMFISHLIYILHNNI